MKITRATEIKVGILLFISFLVLIFIILFGNTLNLAGSKTEVNFLFPNSGGLKISDPIFVNGVKRGNIAKIENYHDSVLIKGFIEGISDIYTDAKPQIMILEITGGKKIEVYPGTSHRPINANQIIKGETPPDLAELIAIFGNASQGITETIIKLETTLDGLNELFGDTLFLTNMKNIATNANTAVADLSEVMHENKSSLSFALKDLKTITTDLKSIISDNKEQLNSIIQNVSLLSEDVKPLVIKADSLISNLQKMTDEMNKVIYQVENGDGFISKLIYDKNFTDKVNGSLSSLDSLVNLIRKNGVNVNVRLGTRP
ncbi:MAG: hypothetical protein A2X64_01680 [Ignavibacteria bacterium GWF2_33_9]|nr:MAG: hypothetical protein A2X64_01680 [Ignavibacteria bacterium GWF2_33_9]